jgi:PBP1b-binding outer membrane lipoprotein LpoB
MGKRPVHQGELGMIRKLFSLTLVTAVAVIFTGCAENEHKVTTKKESQHESTPEDKSPGTMVVE